MNPDTPTPRPLSPSEEHAFEALERAYDELAGRQPSKPATTYSLGYEFRARLRRRGCPGDVLERALALGQRTVDEHEETIDRMNRRLEAMPTAEGTVELQCDLIRGQHPGSTVWVTYTTDTELEDVAEDREPARWSVTIGMGGARVARAGATLKAAAGRATVSMQTAVTISKQQAAFAQAREVEG